MPIDLDENEFSVRTANQGDVSVLVEFIGELAEHEGRPELATISPDTLKSLLFGDRALATAYIGYVGTSVAAYAIVAERFSSFRGTRYFYIEDMLVRPKFRGGGTGKKLLAFLAGETIAKRFDRLEWSALDNNDVALGFYDHLGAGRETGVTHFSLRGEALGKLMDTLDD